jgi:ABC-type transport system involved in cytochrome c biogenesis permease component
MLRQVAVAPLQSGKQVLMHQVKKAKSKRLLTLQAKAVFSIKQSLSKLMAMADQNNYLLRVKLKAQLQVLQQLRVLLQAHIVLMMDMDIQFLHLLQAKLLLVNQEVRL